jgi:ABC-type dipeptide/oligopeptide/nickel transport system ATPase component
MPFFRKYSRTLIVGRSASGKSVLTNCIIQHRDRLYPTRIDQVLYISPKPVSTITAKGVKFLKTIPETIPENSLVVLDDCMLDNDILKQAAQLCVRDIHHSNSHLILIVQRLYVNNPYYRLCVDQMTHVVLFRITKGFNTLARFVSDSFPKELKEYFWSAYHQATSKAYSYLMVDISGDSKLNECLYSNICESNLTHFKA